MTINNVEIKKGDCIIACATEPGGYHYMLGFAFKAENVKDNKIVCTFHEISFDDFVVGYYPEQKEFEDYKRMQEAGRTGASKPAAELDEATKKELAELRERQTAEKITPGYYGAERI